MQSLDVWLAWPFESQQLKTPRLHEWLDGGPRNDVTAAAYIDQPLQAET